jgi:hypothetical protein
MASNLNLLLPSVHLPGTQTAAVALPAVSSDYEAAFPAQTGAAMLLPPPHLHRNSTDV